MNLVQNMDVENKRVVLRCDLNVTIKDGRILSDEKIKASLETIKYLIEKKAKIIILSHLGSIKTEADKEINDLFPVYERLFELLQKKPKGFYAQREIDDSCINNMSPGDIVFLQNTRFEDLDGDKESSCDAQLAKYWASLGDIFINDAFGVSHRRHASNAGIAKYLPTGIGFLMQKELEGLKPLINPKHPFVVIMSGAKVKDKIKLITKILDKCDYLLLGGGIANTFLSITYNMGESLVSNDSLDEVKELFNKYLNKIILPVDGVIQSGETKDIKNIKNNDKVLDIGKLTISNYAEYINMAKTIFINGTVGMYEDEKYANGTKEILKICSEAKGTSIIGGGDALASAEKFNVKKFSFISTGGGATLDYIGNGKLKCMEE